MLNPRCIPRHDKQMIIVSHARPSGMLTNLLFWVLNSSIHLSPFYSPSISSLSPTNIKIPYFQPLNPRVNSLLFQLAQIYFNVFPRHIKPLVAIYFSVILLSGIYHQSLNHHHNFFRMKELLIDDSSKLFTICIRFIFPSNQMIADWISTSLLAELKIMLPHLS